MTDDPVAGHLTVVTPGGATVTAGLHQLLRSGAHLWIVLTAGDGDRLVDEVRTAGSPVTITAHTRSWEARWIVTGAQTRTTSEGALPAIDADIEATDYERSLV